MRRIRSSGFTLVELLIVLSILGLISSLAVPSLFELLRDQRIETASNLLANQFKYAQSEAIRSATPTIICVADQQPPTACATPDTANWAQGWVVFQDLNSDSSIDDAEKLNTQAPLIKLMVSTLNDMGLNTQTKSVVFDAQGTSSYTGNFVFQGDGTGTSKTLILLSSGQIISVSG